MLALQRSAGNAAVGGMLQRERVLAREPSRESLEGAYGRFGKRVGSTDVFAFIARLRSEGSMPDGRGTFTWRDFVTVIGSDGGKKWVKDKWRDLEGSPWGDQLIQGQHEWIKTEDINYVIRMVVLKHDGKDLDAWLSALESLRIPTAEAAFKPTVEPMQIDDANRRPKDFTATSLGSFNGHIGAFYAPRETPHPKDPKRYANTPQTTGEKDDFHIPLEKLLRRHLTAKKNDLPAFLTALRTFQSEKLWGGDIEGLDPRAAGRIPNDFRAKQDADAKRRGRYTSTYKQGMGIKTTFQEAKTVADLQSFAREAKLRNEQMMDNRINAILSLTKPKGIPEPLSNYRRSAPTEAPWILDPAGKSVADYDRDAGYDASKLKPIGTGGDVRIKDDKEPDEVYMQDTRQPQPEPISQERHGQRRSGVTRELELRFNAINLEVHRALAETMKVASAQLEAHVNARLASTPPEQHEAIVKWAHEERTAIQARYTERARTPYDKCIAGKRQLDLQLFEQEPRQTKVTDQQKLLNDYFAAVNALLDAYIAELKAALAA